MRVWSDGNEEALTEIVTGSLHSCGQAEQDRQWSGIFSRFTFSLGDDSTWVRQSPDRHRSKDGVTTQIGDDRFTFFATTFSKSRTSSLELLRAGCRDYVINVDAWSAHLDLLGISQLDVHPLTAAIALHSGVKIATQGALSGSTRAHGLLQDTVIVSDGTGQFRLGDHALCWIHAERLVHTNGSENDIRCHVTKRNISYGTWSETGCDARDVLLLLMKTIHEKNNLWSNSPKIDYSFNVDGDPKSDSSVKKPAGLHPGSRLKVLTCAWGL